MSESATIPVELAQFIARHIESLEQLEILALLVANPQTSWSPEEVFRKVQSSANSVQNALERFVVGGLIKSVGDGRFQFLDAEHETTKAAAALVTTYRERRLKVVECIYGKPSASIQGFADAFKIRRKK